MHALLARGTRRCLESRIVLRGHAGTRERSAGVNWSERGLRGGTKVPLYGVLKQVCGKGRTEERDDANYYRDHSLQYLDRVSTHERYHDPIGQRLGGY